MKKILLPLLLFLLFFNCQNQSLPQSDDDCFIELCRAISKKDFERVRFLTQTSQLDIEKTFEKFDTPFLMLLEPLSDGRFPLKKMENYSVYFAVIQDLPYRKDTVSVIISNPDGKGFKIVHFNSVDDL